MSKLSVEAGKFYRQRGGDIIQITAEIHEGELGYDLGYRFRDNRQETYKPDGSWAAGKNKTPKDLIEQTHG